MLHEEAYFSEKKRLSSPAKEGVIVAGPLRREFPFDLNQDILRNFFAYWESMGTPCVLDDCDYRGTCYICDFDFEQ